jgi:hypothetical protein
MMLEAAYGREMNIEFSDNSSGWTFLQWACQLHPSSNVETSVALNWDKTVHFKVAFYCPQHKVDLCNDYSV